MKSLKLIGGIAFALLVTAACSSAPAPSNNTAANTNTKAAATPAATATPAASPAASNSNSASTAAQDFTLVNETGVEIDKVFISPHDVDDWEEDVLGKDTLPTGQNVEIKFSREETAANWDLKVEDKEGNAITWENLNLLKISKLTLHYDAATKKATATAE